MVAAAASGVRAAAAPAMPASAEDVDVRAAGGHLYRATPATERYELVEKLGAGGFSVVWRARSSRGVSARNGSAGASGVGSDDCSSTVFVAGGGGGGDSEEGEGRQNASDKSVALRRAQARVYATGGALRIDGRGRGYGAGAADDEAATAVDEAPALPPLAIKVIRKAGGDAKMITRELQVAAMLARAMERRPCDSIVRTYEVSEDERRIYIVMELVRGGELFDRIVSRRRYDEAEAACTVLSLVTAVAYLHQRGVVHRDVKAENLMYVDASDTAQLKLIDFGLSYYAPPSSTAQNDDDDEEEELVALNEFACRTLAGTPLYIAPEVISLRPYGMPSDMWSVGVVAYMCVCGYAPFDSESDRQLFRKIKYMPLAMSGEPWPRASAMCRSFIATLLEKEPHARMTAAEALDHPWLADLERNAEELSTRDFGRSVTHLRRFRNKVRLRRAFNAVIAIHRMEARARDRFECTVEEESGRHLSRATMHSRTPNAEERAERERTARRRRRQQVVKEEEVAEEEVVVQEDVEEERPPTAAEEAFQAETASRRGHNGDGVDGGDTRARPVPSARGTGRCCAIS